MQVKDLGPKECEILQKQGLLLTKDHNGGNLEFGEVWSQKAIDQWVRHLFPKAFEWLDAHFGHPDQDDNKYQWVLLQKDQSELFVVGREIINGEDLQAAMVTTGRKWQDRCLKIGEAHLCYLAAATFLTGLEMNSAPVHVIPPSACQDLDVAIERAQSGQAQSDESDGEMSDSDSARERHSTKLWHKMQGLDNLRSSSAPALSPLNTPKPRPTPQPAYKGSRNVSLPHLDSDWSPDFNVIDRLFSPEVPATADSPSPQAKAEPMSPSVENKARQVLKGKGKVATAGNQRFNMQHTRSSTRKAEDSDNSVIEIIDDDVPPPKYGASSSKGKGKDYAYTMANGSGGSTYLISDSLTLIQLSYLVLGPLKQPASPLSNDESFHDDPHVSTPTRLWKRQRSECYIIHAAIQFF